MTAIKACVMRHPVPAYFVLTFAISWGGVLVVIDGLAGGAGSAATADPRFVYALLAMLAGPSLSGLLLTRLVAGKDGVQELLSRALSWRVAVRWHAVALLTAPLLWMATMVTLSLSSPTFLPGIFTSTDKTGRVLERMRSTMHARTRAPFRAALGAVAILVRVANAMLPLTQSQRLWECAWP